MDKICGVQIIRNGNLYDYCFKESIQSMLESCDYVIVVVVESEDNTLEDVQNIGHANLKIISLPKSEWDVVNNKERLSYLTNIAIQEADRMGFQYVLSVQADEILSERSYSAIREAVQENKEGYLCRRINLWKSPYLQLSVPQNRMPCSDVILRLAKVNYRAYGDAESLGAPANFDYVDKIKIWHMGFVRKIEVMKAKVINMQENVFGIDHDPKLDQCEIFNPDLWFNPKTDLRPIDEPLPKLINLWAKERVYE